VVLDNKEIKISITRFGPEKIFWESSVNEALEQDGHPGFDPRTKFAKFIYQNLLQTCVISAPFFSDVHIFIYKGFPFIKYTFGGEINVVFQVLSSFRGNVKDVFVEKTR
jgi:hypothetical protein